MIEITVSNDNFMALLNANNGEKIVVKHKNLPGEVVLNKVVTTKKITMADVEKAFGCKIIITDYKEEN